MRMLIQLLLIITFIEVLSQRKYIWKLSYFRLVLLKQAGCPRELCLNVVPFLLIYSFLLKGLQAIYFFRYIYNFAFSLQFIPFQCYVIVSNWVNGVISWDRVSIFLKCIIKLFSHFWLSIKTTSKIPILRISTKARRKITLFTWTKRSFFSQNIYRDLLIMYYTVITDK